MENKNKKVVFVSPLPPPAGGIATWTKRMIEMELPLNWKSDVVNTKIIGNRSGFQGKKSLVEEIRRSIGIIINLNKRLKDDGNQIIHLNCSGAFTGIIRDCCVLTYCKMRRKKCVLHYRCTVPNIVKSKSHIFCARLLTRLADRVIVLNMQSKIFVEQKLHKDSIIIENFLDNIKWGNLEKKDVSEVVSNIIYVGACIKEKGCAVIFDVALKFPNIRFNLIGHISSEISNMSKPSNVNLIGEVEYYEIIKYLKKSDIFLFPSMFNGEGFPNALLEAMACGLPCIATDWAANLDMIENKGGIIVPINDSQSIINAISVMESKKVREEMSTWNIEKVRSRYLDNIIIPKYINIYEELL